MKPTNRASAEGEIWSVLLKPLQRDGLDQAHHALLSWFAERDSGVALGWDCPSGVPTFRLVSVCDNAAGLEDLCALVIKNEVNRNLKVPPHPDAIHISYPQTPGFAGPPDRDWQVASPHLQT
ncbi:MAG: hypothetical protein JO110_09100 [Acetobacteraceae bacterium]|nr:hypothetical protein [Acetobacteraceae bacterium]